MKQLFTFCSFLIAFNTFSQTVWAPHGAVWAYNIDSFGGPKFLTVTRANQEIDFQGTKLIPLYFLYSAYVGNDFPSVIGRDTLYTYSKGDSVFIGKKKEKLPLVYLFDAIKGDSIAGNKVDSIYRFTNICGSLRGYHSSRKIPCGNTLKDYGNAYERFGNLKGLIFPLESSCIVSEAYYKLIDYRDNTGYVYSTDPSVRCSFSTSTESAPHLTQGISIAPNPFQLSTTLSNHTAYASLDVSIVNNEGREVLRNKMEQSLLLDLPLSGLYQVIVSHEGKVVYKTRVIKQ